MYILVREPENKQIQSVSEVFEEQESKVAVQGFLHGAVWENLSRREGWSKPFGKLGQEPSSSWISGCKSPEMLLGNVFKEGTCVAGIGGQREEMRGGKKSGGSPAMTHSHLILSVMGSSRRTKHRAAAVWLL